MKRELLSKAFGDMDEGFVAEAYRPVPEDASGSPERIVKMKKKRVLTFALAAALTLALGLTAYAAWSIGSSRQEELRASLNIDENNADSYVEYEVSAEAANSLTLLSAINDGQEQRVYVNISPVSAEEGAAYMEKVWFTVEIDGTEVGGSACPVLKLGQAIGSEEMGATVLEQAYDEETQTLTLQCFLDMRSVEQARAKLGTDTVPLSVHMFEEGDPSRSFGPIPFAPTQTQLRVFDFGQVQYHDADSDKIIEIVGLELTPFSAVWKVRYEGDEALQEKKYQDWDAYRPWCALEDKVCSEAELIFSDGSAFSTGGALNSTYTDGAVHLWCSWLGAINIDDLQRIVLGGQILWEAK